jgi:hypothetical protein
MHQLKVDDNGNPKVKNGVGGWTAPVVVGDKFFASTKDAAKKHRVSGGNISAALTAGTKVRGKPVRRATEAEVRKNLEIESPLTYRVVNGAVEMLGPTGHWAKTVVYNNDGLYKVTELAEELNAHQSAIYQRIRDGGDDEVRLAKADDMPDDAIRVYPTHDGKPHKNKAVDAAVKREKKKKEKKAKGGEQFVGVRWPNGSVDVRFPTGVQFMTRDKETDLPDEVRKLTRWL